MEDKEQIKKELTQDGVFLKSIVEKLVEKTGNTYNGPVQNFNPGGNLEFKAPVTNVNGDYVVDNSDNSSFNLAEQLEEFRKELNQQIELNKALQNSLNDAIKGLVASQDKPEEKEKWLNKLQTTLGVIGDAFNVGEKIASIAGKFGLLSLVGLG